MSAGAHGFGDWRGIAVFLMGITVGAAAGLGAQLPDPRLALDAGWEAPEREDLYLEVVIGERSTGRIVRFVHEGGRFFARRVDLVSVGVMVPDPLPVDAEGRIALDQIPGLGFRYEVSTQRMILHLPPTLRQVRTLGYAAPPPVSATREGGWLLTWSGSGEVGETGTLGGTMVARRFGRWGSLESSFVGIRGGERSEVRRIETRWSYTDPERLWRWEVGDAVANGLAWTRPVRLGGVGWSRNFGARPDLVTFPIPRIAGDASVPSAVEVYVDGVEQVGAEINDGPFTVDVLPRIMGAGEAVLRVTDPLGQVTETVVPMYVDASRLAPGLTDFSLQAGVLREGFAGTADRYGSDPVVVGAIRRGLTEAVTLEGYGEAGAGVVQGGVGVVWSPAARWGMVTASAALSGGGLRETAWSVGYQWTGPTLGADLRIRRRGEGFRELADPSGGAVGWRDEQQATLWVALAGGSLSTAVVRWREPTGEAQHIASVDYTRTIGPLTATGGVFDRGDGTTATLSLAIPLAPGLHGSLSHRREAESQTSLAGVRRRTPYEGGWGWEVRGGEDRVGAMIRSSVEHRGESGEARFGLLLREGRALGRLEGSGSVVVMDGRLFASRRIQDAFAVVSTSGRGGVPVRIDHRLYGRTDDDGYLLLPDLHGWQQNRVGVDAHQLGWGVRASQPERVAVPADRTGVLLDFGVVDTEGALVELRGPDGAPLPVGTTVEVVGGESLVVGLEGQVYIASLPRGSGVVLERTLGGRRCRFEVSTGATTPMRGGYLRPAPVSCSEAER